MNKETDNQKENTTTWKNAITHPLWILYFILLIFCFFAGFRNDNYNFHNFAEALGYFFGCFLVPALIIGIGAIIIYVIKCFIKICRFGLRNVWFGIAWYGIMICIFCASITYFPQNNKQKSNLNFNKKDAEIAQDFAQYWDNFVWTDKYCEKLNVKLNYELLLDKYGNAINNLREKASTTKIDKNTYVIDILKNPYFIKSIEEKALQNIKFARKMMIATKLTESEPAIAAEMFQDMKNDTLFTEYENMVTEKDVCIEINKQFTSDALQEGSAMSNLFKYLDKYK